MDNLIPPHAKTNKGKMPATGQRCVTPWGEFQDDNKEDIKSLDELWWNNNYTTHSGDSSKGQGKPPFKDADMPVCQDLLWQDYGEKHRRQEGQFPSKITSSKSVLPRASSPWRRYVHIDTVTNDVSSSDSLGAPCSNRKYVKFPSFVTRKISPIEDFWLRPEACCEALSRIASEVDLELQTSENNAPETSFWSMFQPLVAGAASPKTATPPSTALSSIKEQDKDQDYINDDDSSQVLPAPPQIVASSSQQQDQLEDQDYINAFRSCDILDSMEEMVDPTTVYENLQVAAKVAPEHSTTQENDTTQTADLKLEDDEKYLIELPASPEPDVISNVQERVVAEEPAKLVDDDQLEEETVVLGLLNDKVEENKSGVCSMQEQEEMDSMVKEEQLQLDVGSIQQEQQQVNMMYETESPLNNRMEQYNPQFITNKEPISIVVKLSDMIQGSHQPKLKLSDLIEQLPSVPSHPPPRPRMTLADLM